MAGLGNNLIECDMQHPVSGNVDVFRGCYFFCVWLVMCFSVSVRQVVVRRLFVFVPLQLSLNRDLVRASFLDVLNTSGSGAVTVLLFVGFGVGVCGVVASVCWCLLVLRVSQAEGTGRRNRDTRYHQRARDACDRRGVCTSPDLGWSSERTRPLATLPSHCL